MYLGSRRPWILEGAEDVAQCVSEVAHNIAKVSACPVEGEQKFVLRKLLRTHHKFDGYSPVQSSLLCDSKMLFWVFPK